MITGVAVLLAIPVSIAVAKAVRITAPRLEGLQEQVATIFGALPVVAFLIHPGSTFSLTLNVTRAETVKLAVINMADRKDATAVEPASANELKSRTSTTSVTLIVIA
jgi:hypothetical protein